MFSLTVTFKTIQELQQYLSAQGTPNAPLAPPAPPVPSIVVAEAPKNVPEVSIGAPLTSAQLPLAPPPAQVLAPAPEVATSLSPALVDKNGHPWDARIHASSKAFIADGTWRVKRGVDPDLVREIQASLPVPAAPAAPAPAPTLAPAPSLAPAPTPPASGLSPYTQIVVDTSKAVNAGKTTFPEIIAACQQLGLQNLQGLEGNDELCGAFRMLMNGKL